MSNNSALSRYYSVIAAFENLGERILFSFVALYADFRGATASEQGILVSLRNILSFMVQQFFGKASDKYGRGMVLSIGFIISLTSSLWMIKSVDPLIIIIAFSLYSIGYSAVQPAWSALIGDSYAVEDRSKMLGTIGSIASLVGGVLFLLVGILSDKTDHPYTILFGIAAISFFGALLTIIILSIINYIPEKEKYEKNRGSIFEPLSNNNFRRFIIIDGLFAFSMSTTWPLFPKVTNELATTGQVTMIWFFAFLGFSVTAKNTARLKRYIGSYNVSFYLSRVLLFTVPLTFAFATNWTHLLVARILAGTSFGFYTILQKDYILETSSELNRPEDRGWFLGTHAFMFGLFTFIGSLSSGYISDYIIKNTHYGYSELFIVTSILRIIFSFGFLYIINPSKNFD